GDLTDALVDAGTYIEEGGAILLLTPKTGRDGYVEPSDISEAATTAGLTASKSVSVGKDWSGSRLATPKASKSNRSSRCDEHLGRAGLHSWSSGLSCTWLRVARRAANRLSGREEGDQGEQGRRQGSRLRAHG